MNQRGYCIYFLINRKRRFGRTFGRRPYFEFRTWSSSYRFLKWLDGFLPDSERDSDTEAKPLRTQYETQTLNVSKEIVSEKVYKAMIRICLNAYCMRIDPSSIEVKEVRGKTFLTPRETEQAAAEEDDTEDLRESLVRLATEMLDNEDFINWKKHTVHMWISNQSVIF